MSKNNKTLLTVFLIGAALAILMPSLVSIPMVVIALAITLIVQRIKGRKEIPHESKHISGRPNDI